MAVETPLNRKLAELKVDATEAAERAEEAKGELHRERHIAGKAALAGVIALKDSRSYDPAVRGTKPDHAEARQVTKEACERVIKHGLIFEAIGNTSDLVISDVSYDEAYESATEERRIAANAATAFEREHAEGLAAERKAAVAQRLRDAMDEGDVETVRELVAA